MSRIPKVSKEELQVVSSFVKHRIGICIDEKKDYLIESRLGPLLQDFGCRNYTQLINKAALENDKKAQQQIINVISTHETSWFRDQNPFSMLSMKLLPEILEEKKKKGQKKLRIWSAGCSTGQEVYSIAIILKQLLLDLSSYDIQILGTDVSESTIKAASLGEYNRVEIVRGLSDGLVHRFFTKKDGGWRINDDLRYLAHFEKSNLLDPFHGMGHFDLVFCRNVAIYFDLPTKTDLFNRLADVISTDGYLIIGSTESLFGICDKFERQEFGRAVYYQKKS